MQFQVLTSSRVASTLGVTARRVEQLAKGGALPFSGEMGATRTFTEQDIVSFLRASPRAMKRAETRGDGSHRLLLEWHPVNLRTGI